ncbi:MAG: hypothetical protein OXF67_02155 [Cyanobacteria bacterium MAG CAR4_bin_6]|nr:hypothetical protein [Cyanobacteria bacterium MAG CAR4_bin_6]
MVFGSPQRRIIRQRAGEFAARWNSRQELRETEHSGIFIDEFFSIFDIDCYLSNIIFEYELPSGGRIDVFWPGVILIENKSLGKNLDEAVEQAKRYYGQLEDYLKPKYILVNDFHNFRISSFKKAHEGRANYWNERRFHLNELRNNSNISLFYYFSNHKYAKITETRKQSSESLVREIYIDKSIDEKQLESVIEHETKRVMHRTKYAILKKLTLASGLSLALGYLISDGQPREYLERFIEGSAREESIR